MRSGFERIILMTLLILVVSCSASRQNGFSYRPAYAGPDVSGIAETTGRSEEVQSTPTLPPSPAQALVQPGGDNLMAAELANIVEQKMVIAAETGEKADARKAVTDIAEAYAAEKNITLTSKQMRKLDKYAAKLEKKQQKMADVDWGPQNNLEIFLLAAAGVGLVVGFFSAIGWFVFLVAALVYLYLKLLKD